MAQLKTFIQSAFGLNWIWEMAQMFAFEIKLEEICLKVFFFCTLASVVDLLVTIGIYDLLRRINLKIKFYFIFSPLYSARCALSGLNGSLFVSDSGLTTNK